MGLDYGFMGIQGIDLHRQRFVGENSGPAWIISPHGLGHAARASAVMAACSSRDPGLHHHIFTTVPREFFYDSLECASFDYHRLECDVGMVQNTPFVEDVEETVRALERLPLERGPDFDRIVDGVGATGCRLIVSDIAPLGLAVADRLGVPGVLVENFTWDWIYRAYGDPRLDELGEGLAEMFNSAVLRIQTEPVCRIVDGSKVVAPVSRAPRRSRAEVRRSLDLPADHRMVLLSVTGLQPNDFGRRGFRPPPATTVVVPGAVDRPTVHGRVVWIPTMGGPYHPDLVAASDLVIAKLGYSTVAEVFSAGTRLAYLARRRFPESPVLEDFVRQHIPSVGLAEDWLENTATPELLDELITTPRPGGVRPNGALAAAKLILDCRRLQT